MASVGRDTARKGAALNERHIKPRFCLPSLVVLYLKAVCDGLEYILHSS